ncbi:MAG TPA: NAD(P)-dependent alcohol dehydrogenase [Candidatus Binatia bacterium]|jgi:NADPH:quinone reductase-like Zn-dependent oxidoreductase|nr:NAD(P)-dependent alcohol dehydrogenase [Candidatus Binatia bacterium]
MRAFVIADQFSIDALKLTERPDPTPGHGQVVVQVKAVSLNYRDLLTVKHGGMRNQRLPLIPCSDGAGEVVKIGPGVTRVKPGARVAGIFLQTWLAGDTNASHGQSALGGALDGMLAERVALHEDGLVHIPEHLSYEEASTLPCAAVTAWQGLVTKGGMKAGDTVLVQGTGGVSIFALQFALMTGARVIITSSSDEKLARARQLGATEGLNYKTTPDWGKRVLELTDGAGVDHVVEVGGAGTLEKSFQAVRVGGTVSLIGVLTGAGGQVNPLPVLLKSIRLQGIYVGSREMFEAMNRAIAIHRMRPVIDRVFPFAQTREAFRLMESAAHFGKIVIAL